MTHLIFAAIWGLKDTYMLVSIPFGLIALVYLLNWHIEGMKDKKSKTRSQYGKYAIMFASIWLTFLTICFYHMFN